jgi:TonB-linked SusC/RagA family outer membrane protein
MHHRRLLALPPHPLLTFLGVCVAVVLWTARLSAQAATGDVRGTVRHSASNTPIGSAQVSVEGTRLGAVTRDDGTFLITRVPVGARRVQVRLIGYAPTDKAVTVRAGDAVSVDFSLVPAPVTLEEVLVTGTAGQARRREVGNSIASVKIPDIPPPTPTVAAVLQGSIPGASIEQSGGSIGAGSSIRLRGLASVSLSNQPLIYVDGVRIRSDQYPKNNPCSTCGGSADLRGANVYGSPLDDIDPNDIDRIEVIKGAAASTLYGTEAAAGVIQIFTKKGQQGAATWNAQTTQGFNKERPFGLTPSSSVCSQYSAECTPCVFNTYKDHPNSDAGECPQYLYLNPWLRNGLRHGYSGSVTGGVPRGALRYFVSGDYDNNDGVLPLDNQVKLAVRGNFGFAPTDRLNFEWTSAFTADSLTNTPAGNNAAGLTLNAFRRKSNYFANDNIDTVSQVLSYQLHSWINHLTLGGTVNYTPIPSVTNKLTLGLDRSELENRNLRPFGTPSLPQGGLNDERWSSQILTTDYVGNFEHEVPVRDSRVRTTTAWGAQVTTNDVRDLNSYTEGFPGPGVPTVSSGSIWNGGETRTRVVTGGFFGQEMLGFGDKLFLTLGMRVDGNSAFGKSLGLQQYPKASASYVISDESFFPKMLGTLKLRAAYGEAGRAPGAFDALRTYSPVGWGGQPAFRTNTVGDSALGPERSKETELGFESSAIDDRLHTDLTFYHRNTTDALFAVSQVPSLGFLASQLVNVGAFEAQGLEMSVTGDILRLHNFGWSAGLNMSFQGSKVTSLGGAPAFSLGNNGWVAQGMPVADVRGRKLVNPDAIAAPIQQYDSSFTPNPNLVNFGPSQPTRIFGFTSSLRFPANIELSARAEYSGGNYIIDGASSNALSRAVKWPLCFDAPTYLTPTIDETNWTAWQRTICDSKNVKSDYFVFPANFVKIRDITLKAAVPQRLLGGRARAGQFSISVQNWFRWQDRSLRLFDPEMSDNAGFNEAVRGINEHIPAPATVMAQLRLTF